tara:strand:- start:331 stop:579 length:249 start_codon:yes stop_codon:yes gene_type:complete
MKNKIFVYPIIFLIKIYQSIISPLLGQNCRYLPTCSEFTIESLKVHGFIKGSYFAIKRISSCHPFGKHGYDPIPKKKLKNYE